MIIYRNGNGDVLSELVNSGAFLDPVFPNLKIDLFCIPENCPISGSNLGTNHHKSPTKWGYCVCPLRDF